MCRPLNGWIRSLGPFCRALGPVLGAVGEEELLGLGFLDGGDWRMSESLMAREGQGSRQEDPGPSTPGSPVFISPVWPLKFL